MFLGGHDIRPSQTAQAKQRVLYKSIIPLNVVITVIATSIIYKLYGKKLCDKGVGMGAWCAITRARGSKDQRRPVAPNPPYLIS